MFFLCQTRGVSEAVCGGEQRTLSECEVLAGSCQREYRIALKDGSHAILLSVSGTLVNNLCLLYGIKDGFSVKAPESLEFFEELRKLPEEKFITEKEINERGVLVFHRLVFVLHKSLGTRLVRRTALRIKDHIDSHVTEKTELETLSRIFFMSKTHLYRLFKDEYGISPIRYLMSRKIELSKKLLKNENLKLSEIAESLSFSDAKHFSKTFLKYEGILPSEYRKNIQDKN